MNFLDWMNMNMIVDIAFRLAVQKQIKNKSHGVKLPNN